MVWCNVVWCNVVWCNVVWCNVVSVVQDDDRLLCGVLQGGVMLCCVVWCCPVGGGAVVWYSAACGGMGLGAVQGQCGMV